MVRAAWFVLYILYSFYPPPTHIQDAYLPNAVMLLRVMNFLCHLYTLTPWAKEQCEKRQRERERERKKGNRGMIDVLCQRKQNGKYNLAFSLCGDNGPKHSSNKTQAHNSPCFIKQQGGRSISQSRLGRERACAGDGTGELN